MSPTICSALFNAASSAEAILTLPVSSMSILAPVCSTMPRITLPPGPMRSRILSTGICRVWMRGANFEVLVRGAGSASYILSRMNIRPRRACSSASRMICPVIPGILMSICRAVMPSRVPATLKSISP